VENVMHKNVLIICSSFHHNNTFNIANVIGKELNGVVVKPNEFNAETIFEYDLIGFGSGIYNGKHHINILNLVDKLEVQDHKHVFIFSTSTIPVKVMHRNLKNRLAQKGFDIIGEFSCKGYMDYSL